MKKQPKIGPLFAVIFAFFSQISHSKICSITEAVETESSAIKQIDAKVVSGEILKVHHVIKEFEDAVSAGTIVESENGLLTKKDSDSFLCLILKAAPEAIEGFEAHTFRGYEERLIELGIDYQSVDVAFLHSAAKLPKLTQNSDLVSFLSSLEFSVGRANHLAGVDDRTIEEWKLTLIGAVSRLFAEAVTRIGFFLPVPPHRLNTQIELLSSQYAGLGAALKLLLSRSAPVTFRDLLRIRATVNLVDFSTFMQAYGQNILKETFSI